MLCAVEFGNVSHSLFVKAVGCDGYCRTAEAAVLETGTLLVGQLTRP
jgi:hypothetical protein